MNFVYLLIWTKYWIFLHAFVFLTHPRTNTATPLKFFIRVNKNCSRIQDTRHLYETFTRHPRVLRIAKIVKDSYRKPGLISRRSKDSDFCKKKYFLPAYSIHKENRTQILNDDTPWLRWGELSKLGTFKVVENFIIDWKRLNLFKHLPHGANLTGRQVRALKT